MTETVEDPKQPAVEPIQDPESEPPAEPERLFTQAEMEEYLKSRIDKMTYHFRKEEERQKKAQADAERLAGLAGEERVRTEMQIELENLRKEKADIEAAFALSKAEAKLAALGLPTELASNVVGKDDEETDSLIAALDKSVKDHTSRMVSNSLSHGTPPAGVSAPADPFAATLDRVMGTR